MAGRTYFETLTAAINDIAAHGYDSQQRIDFWAQEIRRAAEASMKSQDEVDRMVREALMAIYTKQVDRGGVLRLNPGVSTYSLERVKPELRAELSRRIAASVDLIKINRPQAIAKTLQRFRGWATSVPKGGSKDVKRKEEKKDLRKALSSEPFETRRVIIDQGHKLAANINDTVAIGGGAVGAFWYANGPHQAGYDGRPEHDARDGKFFLLKGSWADEAGYVKPGPSGWTDDVEQPSVLPFCRCQWRWIYSLRSVPKDCLTQKGEKALSEARRKIANAA